MEASHPSAWQPRLRQQCAVIAELDADVVALQELWVKPDIMALIDSDLGKQYIVIAARRTGSKEDGVAILVSRQRWRVVAKCEIPLHDAGDRVVVVAHIESLQQLHHSVVVASTHLTYPHAGDAPLRLLQARAVHDAIVAASDEWNASTYPSILLGDLNGDVEDEAVARLLNSGWRSAFSAVHRREACCTHVTHDGHAVGVDFVLFRDATPTLASRIVPSAAVVLPTCADDRATMPRPVVQIETCVVAAAAAGAAVSAEGDGAGNATQRRLPLASTCGLEAQDSSTMTRCMKKALLPEAYAICTAVDAVCAAGSTVSAADHDDTGAPPDAASGLRAVTAIVSGHSATAAVGNDVLESASLGDLFSNRTAVPAYDAADELRLPFVSCFAEPRSVAALSFGDYANLSDHRPVFVSFQWTS